MAAFVLPSCHLRFFPFLAYLLGVPITIELPDLETQTSFNLARWKEILADPELAKLPYRIETDQYGRIRRRRQSRRCRLARSGSGRNRPGPDRLCPRTRYLRRDPFAVEHSFRDRRKTGALFRCRRIRGLDLQPRWIHVLLFWG